MKTKRQMWKDINEPKIEKIIPLFDENGKPENVAELIEIPTFVKEWRQHVILNKKENIKTNMKKQQQTFLIFFDEDLDKWLMATIRENTLVEIRDGENKK